MFLFLLDHYDTWWHVSGTYWRSNYEATFFSLSPETLLWRSKTRNLWRFHFCGSASSLSQICILCHIFELQVEHLMIFIRFSYLRQMQGVSRQYFHISESRTSTFCPPSSTSLLQMVSDSFIPTMFTVFICSSSSCPSLLHSCPSPSSSLSLHLFLTPFSTSCPSCGENVKGGHILIRPVFLLRCRAASTHSRDRLWDMGGCLQGLPPPSPSKGEPGNEQGSLLLHPEYGEQGREQSSLIFKQVWRGNPGDDVDVLEPRLKLQLPPSVSCCCCVLLLVTCSTCSVWNRDPKTGSGAEVWVPQSDVALRFSGQVISTWRNSLKTKHTCKLSSGEHTKKFDRV